MKDKYDWMSQYVEMHKSYENKTTVYPLNTSTFSGTQSVYSPFSNFMPIAMQVASKTIGMDLVSVKPMNLPTGSISYIDFQYGNYRKEAIEYLLDIEKDLI